MVIGQPAGIAACEHRRQELDTDHQPNDHIAEAQLIVDEKWNDRQRETDAKIAAEERRDDTGRGTRKVIGRRLRPVHTI
jgi:hypothetical protein